MEEVVRTRLKMIIDSIKALTITGQEALIKLKDLKISIEEIQLISNKLKAHNERCATEIYNYFKLIKSPCADEISQYTTIQMQAEELIAEIQTRVSYTPKPSDGTTGNMSGVTTRLPRMELAKFDGDVLKWHQFWDQFSSNIGSRNINDVDKLLYLQSVLTGEAKRTIEGLDTTSKNYQIAVDTLRDRFGKPSAIVDAHYVALYRIHIAGSAIKECRNVLNQIERHLRVLSSLGEDVNHNHLRVMIMEKFPEDLIYELKMKIGSEDESIDIIRKNLELIIYARETSNRLKNGGKGNNDKGVNNEQFTLDTLHVRTDSREQFHKHSQSKPHPSHKKPERRYQFETKGDNYNNNNLKRKYNNDTRYTQKHVSQPKRRKLSCIFCGLEHFNDECTTARTIEERKQKLRGRCYNCFGEKHRSQDCFSKKRCVHCNQFGTHNRALCPNKQKPNDLNTKSMHVQIDKGLTILQTCVVHCYKVGENSRHVNCRVLLDSGSQRSYVTEKLSKELELPIVEENRLSVFTFGSKSPQQIDSPVVNFQIMTRTNNSRILYANVVPHITHSIPDPLKTLPQLKDACQDKDIILADDGSRNDEIDILLGNDYYFSFITNEKIQLDTNLFLVNSDFGWIWSGQCSVDTKDKDPLSVLTYFQSNKETDNIFYEPDLPLRNDNLQKLWDLESIGIVDSPKSSREEEALKKFNQTTLYDDNRYHVKWPWTEYPPTSLPVNLGLACGRLSNLVKRLDDETLKAYDSVLKEQLKAGIIEVVNEDSLPMDHPVHYLPHHCVLKNDKATKLRIVYDASAKTKECASLNECLYRGPLMLEDLTGLLIRFREHQIGIVADVEKAFLQIGLQSYDRDVTRFLWLKDLHREASPDNMVHYRFCRVPFGVISSPFLLNATVRHHLNQSEGCTYNRRIGEDIYVDNLVTGGKTVEEALKLYLEAKDSFNKLSMNLREWNSNSQLFLNQIPKSDRDSKDKTVKILGIEWELKQDKLRLEPNYDKSRTTNTKRSVLQATAAIYDPCGFVVPLVLPAKLFIQDLWKLKVKWDEPLTQELEQKWYQIKSGLHEIKEISVNRTYENRESPSVARNNSPTNNTKYELHCFTDAAKQAYAAVVYLRGYSDEDNRSFVSFVIGKSRLTPIKDQKDLQIPRLELLGTVIGNRLLLYAKKFLRVHIQAQFLWTDSEIVLSWFNSNKLLPPFVARRINELHKNSTLIMRYVPTNINPADCATRPHDSKNGNQIWLKGPCFLLEDPRRWPQNTIQKEHSHVHTQFFLGGQSLSESNLEIRDDENDIEMIEQNQTENEKEQCEEVNTMETEHSNEKTGQTWDKTNLSTLLRIQKENFPKETTGIKTDLHKCLGLYTDEKSILRCGGRLQNTDWTNEQKNPILLPKNNEFTTKIIEEVHKNNYHIGVSHTLAKIRTKYWILQGRSQVQKVVRNCIQCRKYGGGPYKLPLMPPLPPERVKFSNPFTFTGIDYFGPVKVQEDGSIEKRWVCLFTCLAVRAVHMEVVKDSSAEECVLAIRRFVAVRGLPQVITSDNATQFKLTAEVLTSEYCVKNKISWKFIPELAPWFGGFYERLIGLVKNCMKRTLEKHLINQNQLCTIVKEIEAVVNTRPLTTVGQELEHILTPADFLRFGGALCTNISDQEFLEPATITKDTLINSWKRGQAILQEYVKMFTSQYLNTLRERKGIHKQSRVVFNKSPKVGDIVQIKGENSRAFWRVGKITDLIKGSDGQFRVAKVTLPTGEIFTRSIGHLYPLEVENSETADSLDQNKDATRPNNAPDQTNKESAKPITRRDADQNQPPTIGSEPDQSSNQQHNQESSTNQIQSKTKRASAQRARERVRQWTQQLFSLIL